MKGYKSVGVTKHKNPGNHRDLERQHQFRQKSRSAGMQQNQLNRKLQKNDGLLRPMAISPLNEVIL